MDAVKFLKEKSRMCNQLICLNCQVSRNNNGTGINCEDFSKSYPEKCVDTVEMWSKEHPIKTRQSEFLKMFPNCKKSGGKRDVVCVCPKEVDITLLYEFECLKTDCNDCKKKYWLAEVE